VGDVLVIPSQHTKNGLTHRLPCSERTLELLRASPFKTNSWSKNKAALDAASGVIDWKIHDLRKSYAVSLQRLGVRTETIERLLNHVSGYRAGIVGVYQLYEFDPEKLEAVRRHEEWFGREVQPYRVPAS